MSMIKKLAGDSVIYGLSSILPRLLYYVMGMTYITYRFPEQESVGIYNILYAYTALILTVLVFRLDTAFFRYGREAESSGRIFSTALLPLMLGVGIALAAGWLMAPQIASWLQHPDSPQYVRWFAVIIAADALAALFYARFRLQNRSLRFMLYKVGNVVLIIGFTLLFLEVLPKLWPGGLELVGKVFHISREIDYTFVANVCASLAVLLALLPEWLDVQWQFDRAAFARMLKYSWPLVLVGMAGIVSQSFATPLQERWLSSDLVYNREQAGIYGTVGKLALLLNLFIMAFNYAAEPFFFNNAGKENAEKVYGPVALIFTLVVCLVAVGVVGYLDIVSLFIGQSYREGLHVVPYLLFALIFLGLYYNFSIWYKLSDNTKIGAVISITGMAIMVAVNAWGLPRVGYVASAWAALGCFGFMAVAGWATGQRYYPISYPVTKMLKYIGLAVVLIAGLSYMRMTGIGHGWIWGSLAVLTYLTVAWATDRHYLRRIWQGEYLDD